MSELILELWAEQPGDYFYLARKRGSTFRAQAIKRKDIAKEVPAFINEYRDSHNLYFCPHGFKSINGEVHRKKENAVAPALLYADLDKADPRKMKWRPTIALESSPGRYVGFWHTDKPVTEELNQRMTQAVGADPSGYDLTQVLRIPGTLNFKYDSEPKVKLLWEDGPEYKTASLEKELPGLGKKDRAVNRTAREVWEKWRRKMTPKLLNLLENPSPPQDRSGAQFSAYMQLFDIGLSVDEVEALFRAVPWAKGGENDTKKASWLRNDIENAYSKRDDESPFAKKRRRSDDEDDEDDDGSEDLWDVEAADDFGFVNLDEVEEKNTDWLLHPFFALGELTILQGDGSSGKSYFLQKLAILIAKGRSLKFLQEDQKFYKQVNGNVFFFDPENAPDMVTVKRLRWNGWKAGKEKYKIFQVPISSSIDSKAFRRMIVEKMEEHKPVLVSFDTALHFISGDSNSNSEVTKYAGFFQRLSRRFNCAVVLVRHMNKTLGRNSMTSGQGATAWGTVARLAATIGRHPEDKDLRVVTQSKTNNTSDSLRVPGFRIVAGHEEPDQSTLEFEDELIELSAASVLRAMANENSEAANETISPMDEFAVALKEIFEHENSVASGALFKMLEKRGLEPVAKKKPLERAKKKLGIVSEHRKVDGKTIAFWVLDDQQAFEAYKKKAG